MAIETPYSKPALERVFGEKCTEDTDSTARQYALRWSFPPLKSPPSSIKGELMLTSGGQRHAGWEIGWAQIVGLKHHISEDSLGVAWSQSGQPAHQQGIALVMADGVGGGARGDIASHALVKHCLTLDPGSLPGIEATELLTEGLVEADSAVNKSLAAVTTQPGASTLAAAWLDLCGQGWVSRVGDARLSVLNAGSGLIQPILADQSYANLGEIPPSPDQMQAPARMVGAGLMGTPELMPFRLASDEILMLSSDGLHGWLQGAGAATSATVGSRLSDLARVLALQSRTQGSDDDISILLARKTRI